MEADHKIHSGWGDHISWHVDNWDEIDLNGSLIPVWGHLPQLPKVGETLMGEFRTSWIKFEFVEVEAQRDPPDMFFAKVKAIEQEMKSECSPSS